MKPFTVFLYKLSTIPLDQNPNPQAGRIKRFDTKEAAIAFAKSERNRWKRINVSGSDGEPVEFHGNDMYIGNERIRLSPDD